MTRTNEITFNKNNVTSVNELNQGDSGYQTNINRTKAISSLDNKAAISNQNNQIEEVKVKEHNYVSRTQDYHVKDNTPSFGSNFSIKVF